MCKYNSGINCYYSNTSTHGDASKLFNNSFLLALVSSFFNSFCMQGTIPLHVICASSSIKSKATKAVVFIWSKNLVDLVGLFVYNHITCVLASCSMWDIYVIKVTTYNPQRHLTKRLFCMIFSLIHLLFKCPTTNTCIGKLKMTNLFHLPFYANGMF